MSSSTYTEIPLSTEAKRVYKNKCITEYDSQILANLLLRNKNEKSLWTNQNLTKETHKPEPNHWSYIDSCKWWNHFPRLNKDWFGRSVRQNVRELVNWEFRVPRHNDPQNKEKPKS